jgi:hypothetical protein
MVRGAGLKTGEEGCELSTGRTEVSRDPARGGLGSTGGDDNPAGILGNTRAVEESRAVTEAGISGNTAKDGDPTAIMDDA